MCPSAWTIRVPLVNNGNGERLQGRLLGLEEVRPDLAARGAVEPQTGDGAVPLAQVRMLRGEAVEPAALQRIVLDVAAAALLFPIGQRRQLPLMARLRSKSSMSLIRSTR